MEKQNHLLVAGAVLAVAGALAFLWFNAFGGGPSVSKVPFENLGLMVAEETAKLLGQPGRVVAVTELVEIKKSPNLDAQVKGFKAGLARQPGVTFKELKEIKRPPSDDPRFWPPAQAGQIANFGGGANATVIFMNLPPQLTQADVTALKGSQSKLIAVTAPSPILKPLLQQGILHLAIVTRSPPRPAPTGKETPRQWFDRVYMVVKPDALGDLP